MYLLALYVLHLWKFQQIISRCKSHLKYLGLYNFIRIFFFIIIFFLGGGAYNQKKEEEICFGMLNRNFLYTSPSTQNVLVFKIRFFTLVELNQDNELFLHRVRRYCLLSQSSNIIDVSMFYIVRQRAQAFGGYHIFRFRIRVSIGGRVRVSIEGRVRVSFFSSFRVRSGVRFWLGPGTWLDSGIVFQFLVFLAQFLVQDTDLRWQILAPRSIYCSSQKIVKLQVLKQKMKSWILYMYSVFFTCWKLGPRWITYSCHILIYVYSRQNLSLA